MAVPADVDGMAEPQKVDNAGLGLVACDALALASSLACLRSVYPEQTDTFPRQCKSVTVDDVEHAGINGVATRRPHEHEEHDPHGRGCQRHQPEDGQRGPNEAAVPRGHDALLEGLTGPKGLVSRSRRKPDRKQLA